jgi:hypothetical protein
MVVQYPTLERVDTVTFDEEHYAFEVEKVVRETDAALLVRVDGSDPALEDIGEYEVWVPKSQILDDSEVWQKGDSGELQVTMWIAKQKGWL